ncbi:MAG: DNA polymerase IV [Clostridia bacterium]|nr:DNA polymerase IV [Clostridia bacterium]
MKQRQILHVDVNNAFLSWTATQKLKEGYAIDIREIPAVIGGDEERRSGIVLAKSMKAKACGVVTGETLYQARKKCNNLQVYPSSYKIYKKYSNELYNLLLEYTDKIERFSIDECFLDMTDYLVNVTLLEKAKEINKRVKEELGFTVNVGVAHNKLLAKMASDFEKPNKVHTLYENEIPQKIWNLPVGELFMLGRKTVPKLYNMGIQRIGDLARFDEQILINKFGKYGKLIWEYANGIDNSEVHFEPETPKSIGNSITLPTDIHCKEKIAEIVLALTEQVTFRLRRYDLLANVVSVQLRTKEFKDYSHQRKLSSSSNSTREIYNVAKEILDEMYKGEFIRLVGVKTDDLCDKNQKQLSLFDDTNSKKQEKIDKSIDLLKQKYGYNAVTRGTVMNVEDIVKSKRKE